jgi:glycosyltransferase involved in cell wall biosynthesis
MGDVPSVSVIIQVYNDLRESKRRFASVTDQTYPDHQYEVLAVENRSTDTTRSVANQHANQYDTVEVLVEGEIQSSYTARNTGTRNATGDVLAFLDAEMSVDSDWLAQATTSITDRGVNTWGRVSKCTRPTTSPPSLKTIK